MKSTKRKYGWIPQHKDQRDFPYLPKACALRDFNLPETVDLRGGCPPIYDQGDLGSCTANAIVAAYEFDEMKQKEVYVHLSRLFLYYNERHMEGTIDSDAGANIRDGVKSIAVDGVCEEALWPYEIDKFKISPIHIACVKALDHRAILYTAVNPSIRSIQIALADGFPVVFGFTVYESFESDVVAKTGIMLLPSGLEQCLGGHAVLMVGYDTPTQMFLVRNSWGEDWGLKGYFWMPFSYLHLCSDFWVIKSVE